MYGFNKLPVLSKGAHYQPEDGMCIMELVSFINRERFSDSPKCTDDRIAVYMQNMNDTVTDEERVKLLSVIDRMFHTGDMSWEQRVDFNEELRNVWPELKPLLETDQSRLRYEAAMQLPDRLVPTAARIWEVLYNLSMGSESMDVKLAVLNKILDAADRALGMEETLPQNREEIEKMLAEVQG